MLSSATRTKESKIKVVPSSPHPEVKSMLQHGRDRVVKLLSLCDRRIEQLTSAPESDVSERNDKALLSLARMVLNLHRDLKQHIAMLYPPHGEHESLALRNSQEVQSKQIDFALDPSGAGSLDNDPQHNTAEPSIESLEGDDLKALIEQARQTANKIASALGVDPNISDDDLVAAWAKHSTASTGKISAGKTILSKQDRKKQKFSHSFFQKKKSASPSADECQI